jgi:protoporphyrinogen oxidase
MEKVIKRMSESIAVLGGGFAGLAAAQRAREHGLSVDLYERHAYLGGHAASMTLNGFTFDEGPHVSFTKIPEVKQLLAKGVKGEFIEFASIVNNYFNNVWVKHPVQAHMYGLPTDLVTQCICGFVDAIQDFKEEKPKSYSDWLYANFGKAFSETFPFRYTRKYWTVEPSEMTTDWVGPRMYKPKLEEVIRGALEKVTENKHYIPEFRYPTNGGFGSYADGLTSDANYHLGWEVDSIDPSRKRITFSSGEKVNYDFLISSLPLTELIPRIEGVPQEILDAAERLVCTSVALVDIGVGRNVGFPSGHWQYFYDEDICFARASYPHLLAPSNVPEGCGSIQVEIYYTKQKPLSYKDVLSKAIEDMKKCGMLFASDEIRVSQVRLIKYANVLFNHDRQTYLPRIEKYLDSIGIYRCGRYGLWNYHWTDESIVSGWDAAQNIISAEKR